MKGKDAEVSGLGKLRVRAKGDSESERRKMVGTGLFQRHIQEMDLDHAVGHEYPRDFLIYMLQPAFQLTLRVIGHIQLYRIFTISGGNPSRKRMQLAMNNHGRIVARRAYVPVCTVDAKYSRRHEHDAEQVFACDVLRPYLGYGAE